MKNALLCILSLGTLPSMTPRTQSQDEQQLRKIEAQLAKFEQQNDVSVMSLIANDSSARARRLVPGPDS